MRIDGKAIAEDILKGLTKEVTRLKDHGSPPTVAVILIGNDPGSVSYVRQKKKTAERIGAKMILIHETDIPETTQLRDLIARYNADPAVHGLIVQRPLPPSCGEPNAILDMIAPQKDVDGFVPNSPFEVPVARAVWFILKSIWEKGPGNEAFPACVQKQSIIVLGRGETAGAPIATMLTGRGCRVTVVHSQTTNPQNLIEQGDIIVSCVGKKEALPSSWVKKGAILISVGIWRDQEGKLHSDYDEEAIAPIASFYTPTPGGVGPVNVACLMENVLIAAKGTATI